MSKMTLTCTKCNERFEHIIVHKNTNSRRVCDECQERKRKNWFSEYKKIKPDCMSKKKVKKIEALNETKVSNFMIWDDSNELGY